MINRPIALNITGFYTSEAMKKACLLLLLPLFLCSCRERSTNSLSSEPSTSPNTSLIDIGGSNSSETKQSTLLLSVEEATIEIGEQIVFHVTDSLSGIEVSNATVRAVAGGYYIEERDGGFFGARAGQTQFQAFSPSYENGSNLLMVTIKEESTTIPLYVNTTQLAEGDYGTLFTPSYDIGKLTFEFTEGDGTIYRDGRFRLDTESATIVGYTATRQTNPITVTSIALSDTPYYNVDEDEFYADYEPASSNEDAYFRSLVGLMSGSLAEQDQEPTIATNQPKENGLFVRNTTMDYSSDMNTYYILDSAGNRAFEVYRNGAYTTLEEVAAYIYAFADVPANYEEDKDARPTQSIWGKYLRVNHSEFSGDSSNWPYQPILPGVSGEGGNLQYYEVDIGTTGTDCDPSYTAAPYNNGTKITRGAARIVYAREHLDGTPITDPEERYLFYTYNHYNDFQEYLNYESGWGEMFGNITGGGPISDYDPDYPPTPYVEVAFKAF